MYPSEYPCTDTLRDNQSSVYAEAVKTASRWAGELARGFSSHHSFKKLEKVYTKDFATLLIEKELQEQLKPVAMSYVKSTHVTLNGDEEFDKELIADRELFNLLISNYPDLNNYFFCNQTSFTPKNILNTFLQSFLNRFFSLIYAFLSLFQKDDRCVGFDLFEGVEDTIRRSEINWWKHTGIDNKKLKLLIYNEFPGNQGQLFKELESKGVSLFYTAPALLSSIFKFTSYIYIPRVTPKVVLGEKDWLSIRFERWIEAFYLWQNIFKLLGIKYWFSGMESGPQSIVQRMALESLGGFSFSRQRSYWTFENERVGFLPSHYLYVWSERDGEYLKSCRNLNKDIVVTGHVFGTEFKENSFTNSFKPRVDESKFKIVFFGTGFGNCDAFSLKDCINFYNALFDWLEKSPEAQIIMKPKKIEHLRSISEIASRLANLEKEGRIVVVNDCFGVRPINISRLGDITIGTVVNSAAIENLISNNTTMFFSACKNLPFSFENSLGENVIYYDLQAFFNQLTEFYNDRSKVAEFAPGEVLASRVDKYHDGLGAVRIANHFNEIYFKQKV